MLMKDIGDLLALVVEFITGAFVTQLLLIVLVMVFGVVNSASLTQPMSGEWKSQMEGIQTTTLILFGLIDVCGGLGFIVAFNSALSGGNKRGR